MVPPQEGAGKGGSFKTTKWGLFFLIRYGVDPDQVDAALSEICQIYWHPIFTFISRSGCDPVEAQDLTQRFLVYLIRRNQFARADRTKGPFRSYLLGVLKHFLAHARRAERTLRRGGGIELLPLEEAVTCETEPPAARSGRLAWGDPLDLRWARELRCRVDDRIAAEYAAAEKMELYLTLRRHITGEETSGCYKDDACRLGRTVATIRSDVTRLRQRYRKLLLEEVKKESRGADPREQLLDVFRILAADM